MASLSLRAYLQKIENLIEMGETEESIAHCKHILNKFPKHVDTYRLLGKSYLEMQRYQEASDVLQRVLSVSPDDFVSQIGMSIIREDSDNLDEAIWHMERAFEIQPSNNAVQDELKRLYGRRDGSIPQKILLTRGALVRMYVRGEAYPQAIAEGIAALKEEPLRPDIQLLLAKSYLRTNQINEGYQICQKILESLPFSYEANQLLAEMHILTKQADQAEPYLERVRMLDPYAAFVNENAPTSAKVDQNAIIIEELDYDAMAATLEAAEQSNGSIFVEDDFDTSSLEIPTPGDSQPIELDEDFSWMQDMMDESDSNNQQPKQPAQEPNTVEAASSDEVDLDALFSDDSSSDNEAFDALFSEINGETESEQTPVQAEAAIENDQESMPMPDIFEGSASQNENTNTDDDFAALFNEQSAVENQAASSDDDDFAALFAEQSTGGDQTAQSDDNDSAQLNANQQESSDITSSSDEDLEALLQDAAPVAETNAEKNISETEATEELPDWLKELDMETKDSDIEGNLQKEIDSLFTNGDLPTAASSSSDDEAAETQLDDEEEFTAKFLDELENEPQHPGKTRMFSMTADLSSGDSGPLPPLAESENAVPAEKANEDEIPDWLKQLEEQTDQYSADDGDALPVDQEPATEATPVAAPVSNEEKPPAANENLNSVETSPEDEDDSFAWLESLAAKQGEASETASTAEEKQAAEQPVSEIDQMPTNEATSSSIDTMTEEEEELLREKFKSASQTSQPAQPVSDDDDDSFAWLESLAAKQTAAETPVAETIESAPEPAAEEIIETPPAPIAEEKIEETQPEPVQATSSSSIDTMTEEEEESLREQYKKSHQTGELKQTISDKEEDSFAWLESLAAKQGVSEETLLTDETDRATETPDWLQESDEIETAEEIPTTTEPSQVMGNLSDVLESSEEEPVTISKLEQSEIIDEGKPETPIEEPVWVDEFATPETENIVEDQPLPDAPMEESSIPAVEEEVEPISDEATTVVQETVAETIEEEIVEEPVAAEPSTERVIEAPATPDEIPDWLKDLEDKTSVYALSEEESAKQDMNFLEDVEIPGWIPDVNETLQVELEEDDTSEGDLFPEVHAESFITEDDAVEEQSPEAFEAVGLNIEELEKQLEQEQIIEHISVEDTQEEVAKIQESEPVAENETATVEDESIETKEEEVSQPSVTVIADVDDASAPQAEPEDFVFDIPSDFVDEILQEPEPTGPVAEISDDDTNMLAEFRNFVVSKDYSKALPIADALIDKEVYLESIIEELNKAVVDHPLDPSLFIRLGDAYIRNNQIQKALDMYQEAETLLQK